MCIPGESANAPAESAILNLPGLGGLRLLHATRDDCEPAQEGRRPHAHLLWHCVIYTAGQGSFLLGDATVQVEVPHLVLVSPGVPHSFCRLAGDSTVYSEVTFAPDPRGKPPRILKALNWGDLLAGWSGAPCSVPAQRTCSTACAADVAGVATRMVAVISDDHPHAPVLLQGLLSELLFVVYRHLIADREPAAPPDRLETARSFIERFAEDPIDLAAVAREAGISPKHLSRAFTARFGEPPMRFRNRILLRRAAVLLRTGDQPVARIAERLGFADWRYFSRVFRREFALSPGRYRRAGGA